MVHDTKNPIRRSRRQMDGPDGCNGGVENHAMPRGAINKSLLWLKPCKQQLNRQSIWLRVQPASGVGLRCLVAGLLCGKNGYQGLSVRLSMLHGFTAALTFLGG